MNKDKSNNSQSISESSNMTNEDDKHRLSSLGKLPVPVMKKTSNTNDINNNNQGGS
jgi:hypothetical protein